MTTSIETIISNTFSGSNKLFAIDVSYSTRDKQFYHETVYQFVSKLFNKEKDKIILWSSTMITDFTTYDRYVKDVYKKLYGDNCTDPCTAASFIKEHDFHGHLCFITDGQILPTDVDRCKNLMNDYKFEFVDVLLISTGGVVNESCSLSFIKDSLHRISLLDRERLAKSSSIIDLTKINKIISSISSIDNIQEFMKLIKDDFENGLISKMMGETENTHLKKALVNLKNKFTKENSKGPEELIKEINEKPNIETLEVLFDLYYNGPEWVKPLDRCISYCNGLSNTYDRFKSHVDNKPIVSTVESSTVIISEDVNKFECYISLSESSTPVILIAELDYDLFDILSSNQINMLIQNPLNGLSIPEVVTYLTSMLDSVMSLESYNSMVAAGVEMNSPLTRRPIRGFIALGSHDSHVKYTNNILRKCLTKQKNIGNIDFWYSMLYLLIDDDKVPHLSDYKEYVKSHMIYRLNNSNSYMCLSGLPMYPTYRVLLKTALYSVINASWFVKDCKNEPIRSNIEHFDKFVKLINLIGMTVDEKTVYYMNMMKTLLYFMNLKKKGEDISNMINSLIYRSVKVDDVYILMDGEKDTEIDMSILPSFVRKLDLNDIVKVYSKADKNKAFCDIFIDINHNVEKVVIKNCWEYDTYKRNILTIDKMTCRPLVTINGDNWRYIAIKMYGSKYISLNRRFGDYVNEHKKFPSRGEFMKYIHLYYTKKNILCLPRFVVEFVDEIFEEYSELMNTIDVEEFIVRYKCVR